MLTNTLQNKILFFKSKSSFLWKEVYRCVCVCVCVCVFWGTIQYRQIDPTQFRDVFHRTTL